MKAIFVLFDSLNRDMLPPYGGWIKAPNFARLARRTVTFDRSYVCSMPCMPARRDLLTGRPGFLHRGWGPMEPYDENFPGLLSERGVHTHLISDHQHYWEEGGANYHTKYDTWEVVRGQEGDPWIPCVDPPPLPERVAGRTDRLANQDQINRLEMPHADQQPISGVFRQARKFLERNAKCDNWFLQIEAFDPHEPFFSHQRYKDLYSDHYSSYAGKEFDWPPYRSVKESAEEVDHVRHEYAALVSQCDEKLGELLDLMDEMALWDDTMLLVGSDHGLLLGEHDCWAKCWMPFYEEIARTPFFVWDPRSKIANERRQALVQPALDIAPTLLQFFGEKPPASMMGRDLQETIATDGSVRTHAIFGMFGAHVNITDGKHVYMRGNPADGKNGPLFEYTLMPARMRGPFDVSLFQKPFELQRFPFTKGCYLMKIPAEGGMPGGESMNTTFSTLLFDLEKDPRQQHPLRNEELEEQMSEALIDLMKSLDAPPEQYTRLGYTLENCARSA